MASSRSIWADLKDGLMRTRKPTRRVILLTLAGMYRPVLTASSSTPSRHPVFDPPSPDVYHTSDIQLNATIMLIPRNTKKAVDTWADRDGDIPL